jgi:uncharacterized protein YggE
MQSRTVLAIDTVALLLMADCVGIGAQTPSTGTESSVAGTAESTHAAIDVTYDWPNGTAQSDVAHVRLAVVVTAHNAESARSRVAANASTTRAAVASASPHGDRIRTTCFHLGPIYESDRVGRDVVGYRAGQRVEIRTDADGAGSVVDTAVENGANQIEGVWFSLGNDSPHRPGTYARRRHGRRRS